MPSGVLRCRRLGRWLPPLVSQWGLRCLTLTCCRCMIRATLASCAAMCAAPLATPAPAVARLPSRAAQVGAARPCGVRGCMRSHPTRRHGSRAPTLPLHRCCLPADQFQPFLGQGDPGTCQQCNASADPRLTSEAGADYCTVPYIDTQCTDGAQLPVHSDGRNGKAPVGRRPALVRVRTAQATSTTRTPRRATSARQARSAWSGVRSFVCPGEFCAACARCSSLEMR